MKVTKFDAHTSGCAELRFAFVVHIKDISTQFILTQVFFFPSFVVSFYLQQAIEECEVENRICKNERAVA